MRSAFAAALIGAVFAKKNFSIKQKIDKAFDYVSHHSEKLDKIISIVEDTIEELNAEWNVKSIETFADYSLALYSDFAGNVSNGMVFTQKDD